MIRVFVYDDNPERINSLKALFTLSDNIQFIGSFKNCEQVLRDMENTYPDVVLMDINMPIVDGMQGLELIKTHHPHIKVLIQTAYDDNEKVFTCIRRGASGYILKSDKPLRIMQAIEEVFDGGAAMNPAIANKVLEYFQPISKKSPLSNKESEVLAALAEGLSYKMVADKLGVSYSTINSHTKSIYEKLHISSLGEAIAWYYKNKQ